MSLHEITIWSSLNGINLVPGQQESGDDRDHSHWGEREAESHRGDRVWDSRAGVSINNQEIT